MLVSLYVVGRTESCERGKTRPVKEEEEKEEIHERSEH